MNIFLRLFGKSEVVTRNVSGIGAFEYYKSKDDEYWMIEYSVLSLPSEFDFGTVSGSADGPSLEAIEGFKLFATQPSRLMDLINQTFIETVSSYFPNIDKQNIDTEFFIKSLTLSDRNNFEFGLHSRSKDIFIELFVRNSVVTKIHKDEGCCHL